MSHPIFRFIGSIKLAVPLLTIIVVILIGATFYESQVGSLTVQQLIYKSPWFGALMFLLSLNLGVSAFSRYPWRGARKIGFAFAHFGLILIIAGSACVIHLGTEGLILLRTNNGFNNQIRVEGEFLEVINPNGKLQQTDLFIKDNEIINHKNFAGLSLLDYQEKTVKTVSFVEGGNVPNTAVKLILNSQRMGQTLERWLAVAPTPYSKVPLGIAQLEIIEVDTQEELKSLLTPSSNEVENSWGNLIINSENIDVKNNIDKTIELANNIEVKLVDFWSDFSLDRNNKPINLSEAFNNPVTQLEVSSTNGMEHWFVFSKGDFEPVRSLVSGERITGVDITYQIPEKLPLDYFQVITNKEGNLYYRANSSKGFKSGILEIDNPVTPGWADFKITLEKVIKNGQIKRETVPLDNPNLNGIPALLVETKTGKKQWLTWGEPTTINDSNGDEILAAFSPKLLNLPFAIALEKFIVDRNEGSESVAMWTSKINIQDPNNNDIINRKVWMNHPTWYNGWKIAQASWNPGDLEQSTLQVKKEPIWVTALTWLGSLFIVIGVGIMFYGKSIAKKLNSKESQNQELETPLNSSNETKKTLVPQGGS